MRHFECYILGRTKDVDLIEWGEVQQMQYAKSSHGAFFWNWKDYPSLPAWDMQQAISKGWIIPHTKVVDKKNVATSAASASTQNPLAQQQNESDKKHKTQMSIRNFFPKPVAQQQVEEKQTVEPFTKSCPINLDSSSEEVTPEKPAPKKHKPIINLDSESD